MSTVRYQGGDRRLIADVTSSCCSERSRGLPRGCLIARSGTGVPRAYGSLARGAGQIRPISGQPWKYDGLPRHTGGRHPEAPAGPQRAQGAEELRPWSIATDWHKVTCPSAYSPLPNRRGWPGRQRHDLRRTCEHRLDLAYLAAGMKITKVSRSDRSGLVWTCPDRTRFQKLFGIRVRDW